MDNNQEKSQMNTAEEPNQLNQQNQSNQSSQSYQQPQMNGQVPYGQPYQVQGSYAQQNAGSQNVKPKKKHGCLTAVLIALAVFVLIIMFAALSGGDDDGSSGSSKSDEKKSESEEESSEAPSDGLYRIGDTFSNDDISMTYTEFGEYSDYDEWSTPSEGKKVVYAKFKVTNIGDSDAYVSYTDFAAYCNNEEVSQYYGISGSGLDFSLDLSAGRTGSGTVAFEIPEEVTDMSLVEIEFDADFWSDEKVKFVGSGDGAPVKAEGAENSDESSASQTSDTEKYKVGGVYEKDSLRLTFAECGEYTDYSEYEQPADGYKIIYAKFDIENIGDDEVVVMYTDFNCFADNESMNQYYGFENSGFSSSLTAGRKGTGTVMFEVPTEAESIEVEFSPSMWSSEHVVFEYTDSENE